MTTTSTQSTGSGAGQTTKHAGYALAVIAGAQLMVVLDATIVNIALPSIHKALGFSDTGLSWVLNAYTLTFGGLLLLGGRAGDLFGRRRMFITGVLIFAIASLLGGFAQDQAWLLITRSLQGVGGAIASPTALALVTTNFPEGPERNRAFGVYAAVSGAGAAVGLILGGILTSELSWRWVLFVNFPIGIALALATPLVISESEKVRHASLDLAGALTSTVGIASLVYGFIRAATPGDGWSDPVAIGAFILAGILLATFVIIESRIAEPLMPMRLFNDRTRVGSYIVMLVIGAAVFAMFYFVTQYVQGVLGYSALEAGFAFLPVSAVIIVVAQLTSRWVATVPSNLLIGAGTVFCGGGLLWLSTDTVTTSYATQILPAIMLIAAGMGLIFVPITLTAVSGVEAADSGIASAMLNVTQQIGGTIGLSALVTVFSHAAISYAKEHPGVVIAAHCTPKTPICAPTFTHGADAAFAAGVVFTIFALVAALVLIRPKPGSPTDLESHVVA